MKFLYFPVAVWLAGCEGCGKDDVAPVESSAKPPPDNNPIIANPEKLGKAAREGLAPAENPGVQRGIRAVAAMFAREVQSINAYIDNQIFPPLQEAARASSAGLEAALAAAEARLAADADAARQRLRAAAGADLDIEQVAQFSEARAQERRAPAFHTPPERAGRAGPEIECHRQ